MTVATHRLTRHVALESLFNVRDLGGYQGRAGQTIRWNRVYRADDLSRADRRDLLVLGDLGIRTVIDLRTHAEVARRPSPQLPGARVEHVPMVRETWERRGVVPIGDAAVVDFLVDRYVEMLVEGAPAIADALRLMARPEAAPVLFHCALGKDRTGLLAAVLLSLLGVNDETIAEDYALSAHAISSFGDWLSTHEVAGDPAGFERRGDQLAAPTVAMIRLLEDVRTNARSMVGFVRSIGVPFETIEALHRQLLS